MQRPVRSDKSFRETAGVQEKKRRQHAGGKRCVDGGRDAPEARDSLRAASGKVRSVRDPSWRAPGVSRDPARASAYPVCARRGEYNSPTPTRSPRLSQALAALSSNRSVTSPASFRAGRQRPTSQSKHDASNNSDVARNDNREMWHVKVNRDFKVCVVRHF